MKINSKIIQIVAAVVVFIIVVLAVIGIVRYVLRDEVTVSNTKSLTSALEKDRVKRINIVTDETIEIIIPAGTYSDKEIYVYAPNVTITNYGVFSLIKIYSFDEGTWFEIARGNTIYASSQTFTIDVDKTAYLNELYLSNDKMRSVVYIEGQIDSIYVYGENVLTMSGASNEKVSVIVKSAGAMIKDPDYIATISNNSEGEIKVVTNYGILVIESGTVYENELENDTNK